jgi:tight adherence protein B
MLLLVLALLALTLALAFAGVWQLTTGSAEGANIAERSGALAPEAPLRRLRGKLDRRLASTEFGRRLALRLESAGAGIGASMFVIAAAVVALVGYLLSDLVLPKLLALVFAAGCVRACYGWVDWKAGKRRAAFIVQLPDAARVISNASSAGLSTRTAVNMAVAELQEPAKSEMALVAEGMRIGQSLDGALSKLEDRMPSRDVGVLINTLVIQQRSGGDLVRALQEIADTLEARRDLYREIKTVMAGAVATGYLVAAMGFAAVILLNVAQPGVIEALTSTWPGRIAFLVSTGLYVTGFVLVRRITRIEI